MKFAALMIAIFVTGCHSDQKESSHQTSNLASDLYQQFSPEYCGIVGGTSPVHSICFGPLEGGQDVLEVSYRDVTTRRRGEIFYLTDLGELIGEDVQDSCIGLGKVENNLTEVDMQCDRLMFQSFDVDQDIILIYGSISLRLGYEAHRIEIGTESNPLFLQAMYPAAYDRLPH